MMYYDIPQVTEVQQARYEQLVEELHTSYFYTGDDDQERLKLTFLTAAHRYLETSKRMTLVKAKENFERQAVLNFLAYVKFANK